MGGVRRGWGRKVCVVHKNGNRETQEMVFDAHDRAFAVFKGTCQHGIYDNMMTAARWTSSSNWRVHHRIPRTSGWIVREQEIASIGVGKIFVDHRRLDHDDVAKASFRARPGALTQQPCPLERHLCPSG